MLSGLKPRMDCPAPLDVKAGASTSGAAGRGRAPHHNFQGTMPVSRHNDRRGCDSRKEGLQLFVKLAAGAGNKDTAGNVAFAVLDALYDPGGLTALGTIGALGSVHYFLAVCRLGDLGHV